MLAISPSLLAVALFTATINPNSWDKMGEEDGVAVYTRDVPGSDFREIKAEAVLKAPAEKIWGVLSDVEHYAEFMPYTTKVRVLERFADGYIDYVITDPPVISRRDCITRHTHVIDRKAGLFQRYFEETQKGAPPLPDGVVRMERMRGYWSVESLSKGRTRVEYVVHTEPGGMVPSFLVNQASESTMGEVFRCLRNRLSTPGWKRD